MKPFIIDNNNNISYINSLLFGLFYTITCTENLLHNNVSDSFKIYLQETILTYFVDKIRNHKSININGIESIRNICFYNGWLNSNINKYYDNQNVADFYTFLMVTLNNNPIIIDETIITESLLNNKKIKNVINTMTIPIILNKNTTIKQSFILWSDYIYESNVENDIDHTVTSIQRSITNVPQIIAFKINRWDNKGNKIKFQVDIEKKFKSNYQSIISEHSWTFLCAICFSGENSKIGHYYTILSNLNNYYIFDDTKIPCLCEINKPDDNLINKLKQDTVLVIYKYL